LHSARKDSVSIVSRQPRWRDGAQREVELTVQYAAS
jgi:hypothetical protein